MACSLRWRKLQLHRLHVLGVEGDSLAGLDGRLEPFGSELAHLVEARPAEPLGCMASRYGLMRLGSTTFILAIAWPALRS